MADAVRTFGVKGFTANVPANTGILGTTSAPKAKVGFLRVGVTMAQAHDFGVLINDGAGGGDRSVVLGTLVANKQSTFVVPIKAGSLYDFYHNGGGASVPGTVIQLVVDEVEGDSAF